MYHTRHNRQRVNSDARVNNAILVH